MCGTRTRNTTCIYLSQVSRPSYRTKLVFPLRFSNIVNAQMRSAHEISFSAAQIPTIDQSSHCSIQQLQLL